ncbi:IS630 family transposase [Clostridium manihotivorum]|uniref:IS630 family transposase n=1 Tax=Clostridium manihotivorum TaxID=2320868 RepID=UPI001EE5B97F|nr:IS630 family transposase [Clostridium manihotivorum]
MDNIYSNNTLELNEKINELKSIMKETKNVRMYKRYLVILRHLEGASNVDIAKMVSLDQHTVGDYIKNYKAKGLLGLVMKHSTGAPRKLSKDQEAMIVEIVTNKTPDEVGFESRKNWTIEIIRQWVIKTFCITMSHRGIHEILHRLNLSYTRPTYVLKKADKEKQEEFKVTFEDLKKLINGELAHLLFEDESMIRDYQAIQKTWFKKGQQRKIPTYGKNAGVKLIGILDYGTGKVYCEEHERYDAVVFERFLKCILEQYPTGKIVMILDNARIHHAKLLEPFLYENKNRLELVFLPPYSPELNLIEGLWGWLKSRIINNAFYPTLSRVSEAVQRFITHINKTPTEIIDRLCIKM